jgi:hypothetical protein
VSALLAFGVADIVRYPFRLLARKVADSPLGSNILQGLMLQIMAVKQAEVAASPATSLQ